MAEAAELYEDNRLLVNCKVSSRYQALESHRAHPCSRRAPQQARSMAIQSMGGPHLLSQTTTLPRPPRVRKRTLASKLVWQAHVISKRRTVPPSAALWRDPSISPLRLIPG